MESDHLEVHVGVAKSLADDLTIGQGLNVEVDGTSVSATVKTKLLTLDSSTQTQKVILTLHETAALNGIVDSQACRVEFHQTNNSRGFRVPVTAIVNDQQGLWSCFTIEAEGRDKLLARRQSVEVLHFEGDWVFIRGTIENGQQLIANGLQRLTNGQQVELTGADDPTKLGSDEVGSED